MVTILVLNKLIRYFTKNQYDLTIVFKTITEFFFKKINRFFILFLEKTITEVSFKSLTFDNNLTYIFILLILVLCLTIQK